MNVHFKFGYALGRSLTEKQAGGALGWLSKTMGGAADAAKAAPPVPARAAISTTPPKLPFDSVSPRPSFPPDPPLTSSAASTAAPPFGLRGADMKSTSGAPNPPGWFARPPTPALDAARKQRMMQETP